jgi:hypothetical protein
MGIRYISQGHVKTKGRKIIQTRSQNIILAG